MAAYRFTALATLAMLITYFWTAILVGQARSAHKVKAPAIEGPDAFNRVYRAHVNTLEQLVLMLPALWIFTLGIGDMWGAILAAVWIVGRIMYVLGYAEAADKRGTGFAITFGSFAVAVLGGIWALLIAPALR
jgi:uncharacterized membrane protein YecN with MAPEG domain